MYSFSVWTHGLGNHSFIHLSCNTTATQGGIFKEIFHENNYKLLRYTPHMS